MPSGARQPPSLEITASDVSLDKSFTKFRAEERALPRDKSRNTLVEGMESAEWWRHEQELHQRRNIEQINRLIVREERQTPKKPMGVIIAKNNYSQREAPLFQEMDTHMLERPRGIYSQATKSITGHSTMSPLKPALHRVPSYKQDMYSAKIAARRVKLPSLERAGGTSFSKRAYSHANIEDQSSALHR